MDVFDFCFIWGWKPHECHHITYLEVRGCTNRTPHSTYRCIFHLYSRKISPPSLITITRPVARSASTKARAAESECISWEEYAAYSRSERKTVLSAEKISSGPSSRTARSSWTEARYEVRVASFMDKLFFLQYFLIEFLVLYHQVNTDSV